MCFLETTLPIIPSDGNPKTIDLHLRLYVTVKVNKPGLQRAQRSDSVSMATVLHSVYISTLFYCV